MMGFCSSESIVYLEPMMIAIVFVGGMVVGGCIIGWFNFMKEVHGKPKDRFKP